MTDARLIFIDLDVAGVAESWWSGIVPSKNTIMSEQTNVLGVLIWTNFEYLYRYPSWEIKAVVSKQRASREHPNSSLRKTLALIVKAMIECDVKLDYEVFNAYNPKATIEIDLHTFALKILTRLDDTLESIKERREDIFEEFAKLVISAWSESEGAADIDYGAVIIGEIEQELPDLTERMDFLRPALRFILSHLRSQGAKAQTPRKTTVLYIDREKAENILFYNVVKVLVDLLGKEKGINTYKDAVDYLADRRAEDEPDTTKIEQFRQGLTGSLPATGGYTFAVADLDDSMILAKFDKCVVHESLKHVSDPELAYYATCYTNMTVANRRNRNVEIRRTQTLFSGEFCDELYWDPEVHDEPAQPSLTVSRSLRIEQAK